MCANAIVCHFNGYYGGRRAPHLMLASLLLRFFAYTTRPQIIYTMGEAYLHSLGGLAPNHNIGALGHAPPNHTACRGSVLHSKHVPRMPGHMRSRAWLAHGQNCDSPANLVA